MQKFSIMLILEEAVFSNVIMTKNILIAKLKNVNAQGF